MRKSWKTEWGSIWEENKMDINHIPRAPSGLSRRILACVLTAAVFCTGCLAAEPQAAQPAGSSEGISSVESKNAREQEPEAVSSSLDPEISAVQTVRSYPILEGTEEENTVVVIEAPQDGPCIFIVGGIHGDETAGWKAAERLKEEVRLTRGTLYILSPANRSGAEADQRYVVNSGDLNRAFPGDPKSSEAASRIAAAMYREIERIQPDLVLDLHESKYLLGTNQGYGLGNTLIYTDDSKISDLLLDFLIANEEDNVCSEEFALTTPGIAGSFNRVVTDQLEIPVITTETWRGYELPHRIGDQMDIVSFCLRYYQMIDG